MMFPEALTARAAELIALCQAKGLMVVTAESCTGGLVAALLTEIAGSSSVVDRSFVTYSNEAKQDMLGVSPALLAQFGAVSEPVARAMAEGALVKSLAGLAISITGIAGPGGGSADKPVGTVHFACATKAGPTLHRHESFGDIGRANVRIAAIVVALDMLLAAIDAHGTSTVV